MSGATEAVRAVLDRIELAASRFRKDSELSLLRPGVNHVSATLADLVAHALRAARETEGLVDPTVGGTLTGLGYDRSIERIVSALRWSAVRPPLELIGPVDRQGREDCWELGGLVGAAVAGLV